MVNGKYYIGKHQTKDLDDGYMGSGKLIRAAIKKYGIEQFKKEILFVFETEEEMNKKEAELVTEELVASGSVYNLCPGGQGGFGYCNAVVLTAEVRKKNGRIGGKKSNNKKFLYRYYSDSIFAEEHRKHLSKIRGTGPSNKGKEVHSNEWKEKHSFFMKENQKGSRNSQFGTMWITNGTENKKIKKDIDSIPEGWYKGRKRCRAPDGPRMVEVNAPRQETRFMPR